MLPLDGVWHVGEVSSGIQSRFRCARQMAHGLYGVLWVSGLASEEQ